MQLVVRFFRSVETVEPARPSPSPNLPPPSYSGIGRGFQAMTVNARQWSALHKEVGVHKDRPRAVDRPFRTCSRCHESLPSDQFRLDSRGYKRSHCIECAKAVTREWRKRNRAELARRRRTAYKSANRQ